ncbi:MAG: squalene synthase HpnC [bacterium]
MSARNISPAVRNAFQYCETIARRHYENFPVATFFLPAHLRPSIAAIYAFARTADDFADEGNNTVEQRLSELDEWQRHLDECYEGRAGHPIFIALHEVATGKNIPKQLFADLLIAFRQDVTKQRYSTYDELLDYCNHSANPVGRLVLSVFDDNSDRHFLLSDKICTALQLANFWQDIHVDILKNRIYIPLEDMSRFGYTEGDLVALHYSNAFGQLMRFQVERTKELFESGKQLLGEVVPELRFELRLTWNGGMKILEKIEQQQYNVLKSRPKITTIDKVLILLNSALSTKT